jgi:hypothetical protein
MGNPLIPGNLKPAKQPDNPPGNATDYTLFVNSMAAEIETQLDALMQNDGLPPLVTDPSDQTVRDRRRLIVAIARGVVLYLAANKDAFVITTNNVGITAQLDHIATG